MSLFNPLKLLFKKINVCNRKEAILSSKMQDRLWFHFLHFQLSQYRWMLNYNLAPGLLWNLSVDQYKHSILQRDGPDIIKRWFVAEFSQKEMKRNKVTEETWPTWPKKVQSVKILSWTVPKASLNLTFTTGSIMLLRSCCHLMDNWEISFSKRMGF